jgi:hypothetical protein
MFFSASSRSSGGISKRGVAAKVSSQRLRFSRVIDPLSKGVVLSQA